MSEISDRDEGPPELDAAEESRLSALLRHAFAPSEIEHARHERLLLAALEDPFAEASPEELLESERLRRALDGDGDHEHLRLGACAVGRLRAQPRSGRCPSQSSKRSSSEARDER